MEVVCIKCGEITKKSILTNNPTCKDCKIKNANNYYLKNKERLNELRKKKRKINKMYGK